MTSVLTSPKLKVTVREDFDIVVNRLRQAINASGFHLLVDTSVKALVQQQEHAPVHLYWLFGVYRADLVARGFVITPESALLIQHTLTVAQVDDHITEIMTLDPRFMSETIGNLYLAPVAEELHNGIERIIEAVTG